MKLGVNGRVRRIIVDMKEKSPAQGEAFFDGDPYGTRTRVSAVKGQRPRPLDEGTITWLFLQIGRQVNLYSARMVIPTGLEPVFPP